MPINLKAAILDPQEIIPIEAPHKPESVAFFESTYTNDQSDTQDNKIPYVLVHRSKDGSIYTMDGHHRIATAHMHGRQVKSIFINTFKDWADLNVLMDMRLIPPCKTFFDTRDLPNLMRELTRCRMHAQIRGVSTFDDFVQQIKDGIFWKYDDHESLVLNRAFVSSITDSVIGISFVENAEIAIYTCDGVSSHNLKTLKSVYGELSQEDRLTLIAPESTSADFEKLRKKYSHRQDLINLINSYDPNHPLYKTRIAKIHEITQMTHSKIAQILSETN